LQDWAARRDEPVIWYRDAFAGKPSARPGWDGFQAAIARGGVGTLIIWRLDRLCLTARGLSSLFEELNDRGVNLVSLREGINLATPAGRSAAAAIASIARYESEVRSERVRAGLAEARERGVRLGRRPGVRTKVKVTPEQEAMIHRLKAEGQGVSAIARATGLSRPTVYSVLTNPPDTTSSEAVTN
jgi:DNA invertase Pin-like site-specific DNA recombinase